MHWPYLVLVPPARGYGNGIFLALLAIFSIWFREHAVTAIVYLLYWPYLVLIPRARGRYGNGISHALAIFSFGSAGTRLRQWCIPWVGLI